MRALSVRATEGLAISSGFKIGAMASAVLPYPTLAAVSRRTAGGCYTPKLFGPTTRRVVGFIQRFLP